MDSNELARKIGAHQCILGYIGGGLVRPTEEWLPLFGHVNKDGEIDGTMYEGCTLLPAPYHVYFSDGLNTRDGFDAWLENLMINAANINEAARQVKEALNLPKEHTVKLFLTLVNTHCPITGDPDHCANWGEIDGVKMDHTDPKHGLRMNEYMMDAYIKAFAEAKFEHVEVLGFYMFDEGLQLEKLDWHRALNDLIHSKGYLSMMAPYFKSKGYRYCREVGYDLVSMQSNFFLRPLCWGSTGSVDRIDLNLERIEELGYGIVPETSGLQGDSVDEDAVSAYKITLKKCLEHNFAPNFHLCYCDKGILKFQRCQEEYGHSVYDELYRYMHGELKIEDMEIREIKTVQGTVDRQFLRVICNDRPITAAQWLPAIAYQKDGAIVDAMFPFAVMQPPKADVKAGKYTTKASWNALIDDIFRQLDALEQAVAPLKQLEGKAGHRVGVVFPVIHPKNSDTVSYDNWGELDGERMDPNDPLHRRRMIKYMIDECLAAFHARQYRNVSFNGFCWMEETLDSPLDQEKIDWYVRTNDLLIDARGFYMTVLEHKTPDHKQVYRAGFGMVPMRVVGETEEELMAAVNYNKSISTGFVAELASLEDQAAVDHFRRTLKCCLKAAVGDHLHLYEFGDGPVTIAEAADADRALYDELYAYLKHTLTADDIVIE